MNKDLKSEKVLFFSKLLQYTETKEEFLMGHKTVVYIIYLFII